MNTMIQPCLVTKQRDFSPFEKAILEWYKDYLDHHEVCPTTGELFAFYEQFFIDSFVEAFDELKPGERDALFYKHRSMDVLEIAKRALLEEIDSEFYIFSNIITLAYLKLNLCFRFQHEDYGNITDIEFASYFDESEKILGAQVPVFRRLPWNGLARSETSDSIESFFDYYDTERGVLDAPSC